MDGLHEVMLEKDPGLIKVSGKNMFPGDRREKICFVPVCKVVKPNPAFRGFSMESGGG